MPLADPAARRAYLAEYGRKRRAHIKAYASAYYQDNREAALGRAQEHYAANRARVIQRSSARVVARRDTPDGRAIRILAAARTRSGKAGIPCTISSSWIAEQLRSGTCALTGMPFDVGARRRPAFNSPSLDRIVPSLGYVPGNCRVVLWAVNAAKGPWDDATLLTWARALVSNDNTQE